MAEAIAVNFLHSLESFGNYAWFAVRGLGAALGAALRPRELGRQLLHVHVEALPLATAAGLALGIVIWMHLRDAMAQVAGPGAVRFLPQALALAVTLEFAPIGAGLIVAGRSGAGLAAELGSMRLSEQIDAIEVLGQSPMRLLVGPRVLACMIALPMLTIKIAFLALLGSFAAETIGGKMSPIEYANASLRGLRLEDVVPATLKTVVFGYLVGVTACHAGMNADGGTEGLGRAVTRSVVVSIFLVVVSDVFLVKLIQLLNAS
jgi:phospholipid/cholesterol/gamma-HCH transport system permease protein